MLSSLPQSAHLTTVISKKHVISVPNMIVTEHRLSVPRRKVRKRAMIGGPVTSTWVAAFGVARPCIEAQATPRLSSLSA